jgi:hypothetical protein
MTRMMIGLAVAGLMATGAPAMAKKAAHKGASCQQVKDALAAGKAPADVAKDLSVSEARVKSCSAPAAHPKKTHKAS